MKIQTGDFVRTLSEGGMAIEKGWIIPGKLYRIYDRVMFDDLYYIRDEMGDRISISRSDFEEDFRLESGKWELLSYSVNLQKILGE